MIDTNKNLKNDIGLYAKSYFDYLHKVLYKLDLDILEKFIKALLNTLNNENKIFFIGNGGSASTASHFANDLAIGTNPQHKKFKVISLTDNNAVITAIANDFGYEYIFSKQIEYLAESGDVLIAITASGNSKNILNAIEYAKQIGMLTVGLTGFNGGKLKEIVDIPLHFETKIGEYGPVEDAHMIIDHLVTNYLKVNLNEYP